MISMLLIGVADGSPKTSNDVYRVAILDGAHNPNSAERIGGKVSPRVEPGNCFEEFQG